MRRASPGYTQTWQVHAPRPGADQKTMMPHGHTAKPDLWIKGLSQWGATGNCMWRASPGYTQTWQAHAPRPGAGQKTMMPHSHPGCPQKAGFYVLFLEPQKTALALPMHGLWDKCVFQWATAKRACFGPGRFAHRPGLPTCRSTYPPYLPTYIPAYPPTCLPTCLPSLLTDLHS